MRYEPSIVPAKIEELLGWLVRELKRISDMQNGDDRIAYREDAPYPKAHIEGAGLPSSYYVCGFGSGSDFTTGNPSANILRAIPFLAPGRIAKITQIAFNVTTLLAGNARIGIYDSVSDTNIYPNKLLVDSGDISTNSNGVKTFNTAITLTPGKMYWMAFVNSVASTLRCGAVAGSTVPLLLPDDASLGTTRSHGLQVAHAYAALPSTFTAGATFITGVPIPCLAYRFGL